MSRNTIINLLEDSISVKQQIAKDNEILSQIENAIGIITDCFKAGGKVLFCGNGGSAADAQHLAAELSGRFLMERISLNAEALHVNTSYLTAAANDYGFEHTYSRLIEAKGFHNDVLVALSTSGNSKNVVNAIKRARDLSLKTIGLTGLDGGQLKDACDICIKVPSKEVPRIQEAHILIGHIICQQVETGIFSQG